MTDARPVIIRDGRKWVPVTFEENGCTQYAYLPASPEKPWRPGDDVPEFAIVRSQHGK